MTNAQIEVIPSVKRRRRWWRTEKERIVAAALEPGAVASEVARAAGFRWRQQLCKREPTATAFNAVAIAHEPAIAALPSPSTSEQPGTVEIEFAAGGRMRIMLHKTRTEVVLEYGPQDDRDYLRGLSRP